MILPAIIKILLFFVLFSVIAIGLFYYVFMKGEGDWSVLPKPLRYPLLPIYSFVCVYFGCLIFQWYLVVPNSISFLINQFFVILSFFHNVEKVFFVWQLIGDLLAIPYLVLAVCLPAALVNFTHDEKYSYNYSLMVLIITTLLYCYEFTIDTLESLQWYENALFLFSTILSALTTYVLLNNHFYEKQKELKLSTKIKMVFKLFFSKNNPLIKIFKR